MPPLDRGGFGIYRRYARMGRYCRKHCKRHDATLGSAKGCIVTEIVIYPRKKVLNIFLAGGELDQILDMDHDVKNWAKEHGCTAATMSGRIGWKKPLKPLNWKMQHVSFLKEFEDG